MNLISSFRYKDDEVIDYKKCIEVAQLQLRVVDLLPESENTLFVSPETMSFSGSTDENFEERKSLLKVRPMDLAVTNKIHYVIHCLVSQDLLRLSVSAHKRARDPQLSSRHSTGTHHASPVPVFLIHFAGAGNWCWISAKFLKVQISKTKFIMPKVPSGYKVCISVPPFVSCSICRAWCRLEYGHLFFHSQMPALALSRRLQSLRQAATVSLQMRLIDQVVSFATAK